MNDQPMNPSTPPPPPSRPYVTPPAPFAPEPRRRFGWGEFFGGALLGCGCLPVIGIVLLAGLIGSITGNDNGPKQDSVGLIDVTGVITSGSSSGGLMSAASAGAQDLVDQLESARKDSHIKSVVIYIDSPGGSATGSDVVYQEIQKVRAGGKKVVVSMGDVAASGGYYIASASDHIFANGATVTGSIGVISELPNYSDPQGWIHKTGYDTIVIKSGKFKDMGNPGRAMTSDEKALFQKMVNDIYEQFLASVSKGRNIPVETLRPLADGRVYTGRDAIKLKLIDEIGTLQDAEDYAGQQSGLGASPHIYKLGRNWLGKPIGDAESMYQGSTQRDLLGLLLMDPRAAHVLRGGAPTDITAPYGN